MLLIILLCLFQVFGMPALCSTQEEADTRLLLHTQFAIRSGLTEVVVVADDMDVMILLLTY